MHIKCDNSHPSLFSEEFVDGLNIIYDIERSVDVINIYCKTTTRNFFYININQVTLRIK